MFRSGRGLRNESPILVTRGLQKPNKGYIFAI